MPRTIFAVLMLAVPASGATVHLGLISKQIEPGAQAGVWELWAWTSAGDNDGILSFTVDVSGEGISGEGVFPGFLTASVSGFPIEYSHAYEDGSGVQFFAGHIPTTIDRPLYGVGSPDTPARIEPPPQSPPPIESRQATWWLGPTFLSSPAHPPNHTQGDSPFVVPSEAAKLLQGMSDDYLTVQIGDLAFVPLFELGESLGGGTTWIEDAEHILFVDHVGAVPEPHSGIAALLLASIVGVPSRRSAA